MVSIPQATMVAVGKLTPAKWNPRTISDPRFKNLCESLKADPDFLGMRPIIATLDGTVVGGNMRLRAALALGWSEVPALLVDMDETTAKARALRDNGSWGEWVEDDLAALLRELQGDAIDVSVLGFDDIDLSRILATSTAPADVDEVPELPRDVVTKLGDVWTLGDHRLVCGDATDAELRLSIGATSTVVVTDPPYGVNYQPLAVRGQLPK